MPRVCVFDAETYYDREYSLSKITTEEYVRSQNFQLIGFATKFDDAPSTWVGGPGAAAEVLAATDWSDTIIVAQNTQFDGAILAWRYGVKPLAWIDIMGMSRALFPHEKSHSLKAQAERMGIGQKGTEVENALGKRYQAFTPDELARYGEYCKNDVELTYALFHKYMGMGFPKKELKLMDMTLRMYTEPRLVLDPARLQEHLTTTRASKQALMETMRDRMLESGDPTVTQAVIEGGAAALKTLLMSNKLFAGVLESLDVDPPMKVSPATGKPTYAFSKTDEAFKALEEHPDARVQAVVAARLGTKTTLEETRTERLMGIASRGALPIPLRYYGAHSGRWSGEQSINLQNLPSRGPNAGAIKRAIKAPEGYVVIDCDSAQIEARVLAWLAGQEDLVQAFRDKQDVYKLMASKIYGVAPDKVDKQQRQVGKTVVLGAGYGVGHVKLQGFLKMQAGVVVSLDEAKRIIDTYRYSASHIAALWARAGESLKGLMLGHTSQIDVPGLVRAVPGRGLTLPNGLHIQYPNLRAIVNKEGKRELVYDTKGIPTRIYGGKVCENFTQAIARCVVAEQMLRIQRKYQVVLCVHDAAAIIAKKPEAEEAQAFVEDCMRWVPPWAAGLPLSCESGMGESYGDC